MMKNIFREGCAMSKLSFEKFITGIGQELSKPLPGTRAQWEMVPSTRTTDARMDSKEGRRLSAVMVLFYPKRDSIYFALVKRVVYNGVHSGQISLPGGQFEDSDQDFAATALRETQEEIGIDSKNIKLLGRLTSMYIPPSNFDVYPFVGYVTDNPVFHIDPVEIDHLMEIELDDFMNPACKTEKQIHHRTGIDVSVPCFYLHDEVVWGATAMILNELREVLLNMESAYTFLQ